MTSLMAKKRYSAHRKLSDMMDQEICELYRNIEIPVKLIAQQFNVSPVYVTRVARKYGIPLRKPKASFWD
jgi:hypothetical protein